MNGAIQDDLVPTIQCAFMKREHRQHVAKLESQESLVR